MGGWGAAWGGETYWGGATTAYDPTPFNALLDSRNGRRPIIQVYIEGLPDVLCTESPLSTGDTKATGTTSVSFNATNSVLATSSITDLAPDGDITFVIWFRPGAFTAGDKTLFSWCDSPMTKGYWCYLASGGGVITLVTKTTTQTGPTATALVWNCLVISQGGLSGIETRFLLLTFDADGNLASTTRSRASGAVGDAGPLRSDRNSDSASLSAAFQIGAKNGGSAYFGGYTNYAAIYDRAFTASEMERIVYRILDAKWTGFWEDLVAQWIGDETSGATIKNSASNAPARNLTYTGTSGGLTAIDPPWTITYRPYMTAISAAGQDLEARATRTAISGISFTVLDTAGGWLTAYLARAGRAVRRKSAYVFLGFDEILEEDYELIMNGAVESIDPLRTRGYEVRIGDAVRFARTAIQLGSTTLSTTVTDVATTFEVGSLYNFTGRTGVSIIAGSSAGGYFRIDDEIVAYDGIQASPVAFTNCTRARFGTAAAAHTAGAQIKEVFARLSINPISMMLLMLISGTGGNTTHASYDVYVRYTADDGSSYDGRGAGISLADIDVDDIEDVRDDHFSTYSGDFIILDSIDDLKDWIEEHILRPLGAFFYARTDGRLSIGTWHTPASSGVSTLEQADQAQPEPLLDYSKIINSIEIRYDLDPITGEYASRVVFEEIDSGRNHGAAPPLRIDSPWIRTTRIQGGATITPTPTTITTALKTLLFALFKDPQAIVTTTTGLARWEEEVGAGIRYQHEEMPDFEQGFRGVQGELFQVVGRTLDVKRARVVLKMLRVPT